MSINFHDEQNKMSYTPREADQSWIELINRTIDLEACFKEANPLIKKRGIFIVQDQTPEDYLLPGNENHIRGYFFE